MKNEIYISHAVQEKNAGDSSRLKRILEEGAIKPTCETGEANWRDLVSKTSEFQGNGAYTFYKLNARRYNSWSGLSDERTSGIFYLDPNYISDHPELFLNGSYMDDKNVFDYDSFDILLDLGHDPSNSPDYVKFCNDNGISYVGRDIPVKRLNNQLIAKSVPLGAIKSLILTNKDALNEVKSLVPKHIELFLFSGKYLLPKLFGMSDSTRIPLVKSVAHGD